MITNYMVLDSPSLDDLVAKVNAATSEMAYHVVASASYRHHPDPARYYPDSERELMHYVWLERWAPWSRYTTVGPGVVVENVLGRPIATAAGVVPPGGVIDPRLGIVRPGVVQPVAPVAHVSDVVMESTAQGRKGYLPEMEFIKLTQTDETPVYIRPANIFQMHFEHDATTVVAEAASGTTASYLVKEKPEEILQLSHALSVPPLSVERG
jgi:hypothetical protein